MQRKILLIKSLFGLLGLLFAAIVPSWAQKTVINGRVTDAASGDPLPFVSVYFKGTTIGVNTDFEGYYNISTEKPLDSLHVSYIGYNPRAKKVQKGITQTINFQLAAASISLQEVVVRPGENPAWPIMRQVIAHKDANDKRNLTAYEYESYNKTEVDIDNISPKFRKKKLMRKILAVLDSLDQIAGEDGKPVLPFFISESISNFYHRSNPSANREEILKTKVTGVGLDDGSLVAQIVGSSFQEYNFYKNWLTILEKDFVSPIADGWKFYYEYDLKDSSFVGEDWCYRIEVTPKRPQDLAFNGTIWITAKDFALKQVNLAISKSANINYIERITIHQELGRTAAGPWLPIKNRVMIDIAEISDSWAGMLVKFYTSNKKITVNNPKPPLFYEKPIEVAEDARLTDNNYWETNRHDTLTQQEKNVYKMIDTIRNIPVVKTYIEIANIAVNGYKRVGKVDIGPYLYTYAFNNVEGHRFRGGLKTNIDFSRKWVLKGYLAYGTRDGRFKYSGSADYILSRKRWATTGIEHFYELEQLALVDNSLATNSLFFAFTRFGDLTRSRPFMQRQSSAYIQTEVRKGLSQKLTFRNRTFDPIDRLYKFAYYEDPNDKDSPIHRSFTSSEITWETRYARDEIFLQNENERISLGADKWPIFTFRYTLGLKGVMNSDFEYHKFSATVIQYLKLGLLGRGRYAIDAGYIPSTVPYPFLRAHLGNQTPFFNASSFNLMNYFEFASDKYVSLNYQHTFEGLFLNSIPLIRKLKWRFVGHASVLYGGVSKRNQNIIPDSANGEAIQSFRALSPHKPYAEFGYGVENIFKLLRVDFIHRIAYLNNPDVRKFGVKVSLQFKL